MTSSVPVDIGISEQDREEIADALTKLLADSYTLYLKTHNYHWNVTGPQFGELHTMFENQYLDLATAVDDVAERIRALGHLAEASFAAFTARTAVSEAPSGKVPAMEMVRDLAQSHAQVARSAGRVIEVATPAADDPTVGLATDRKQIHEKTAWMLRAYLE